MPIAIVTVTVFAAITLISYLALARYRREQARRERLQSFFPSRGQIQEADTEPEITGSPGRRLLGTIGKGLRVRRQHKLELELAKADIDMTAAEFVALNALCGLGPLLLVVLGQRLMVALLLCLIGMIIPQLYLRSRQRKRAAQFAAQIPDALTMIANALKAGHSFLQASELVAEEMAAPISTEFKRALKEMNLGLTTEAALLNMVQRVDSEDFDMVVTAVLIQRQVGGNLAEVLDSIAFTIRERLRIKGEIKTLTAQGRISGLVISLLPLGIGFFVFVINPSYMMELFTQPLGQVMIVAGVVGQLIAAVLIKGIVTIEV